jgi:hypothetical protein
MMGHLSYWPALCKAEKIPRTQVECKVILVEEIMGLFSLDFLACLLL